MKIRVVRTTDGMIRTSKKKRQKKKEHEEEEYGKEWFA